MACILFIDDEEQICITCAAMLKMAGHEVVTAADGQEGVELFQRQHFDLVITDLVMPRMGGPETVTAMRRLRPELKVIVVYGGGRMGGSGAPPVAQAVDANRIVAKPFTMEELNAAVREILDADRGVPGDA